MIYYFDVEFNIKAPKYSRQISIKRTSLLDDVKNFRAIIDEFLPFTFTAQQLRAMHILIQERFLYELMHSELSYYTFTRDMRIYADMGRLGKIKSDFIDTLYIDKMYIIDIKINSIYLCNDKFLIECTIGYKANIISTISNELIPLKPLENKFPVVYDVSVRQLCDTDMIGRIGIAFETGIYIT